MASIERILGMTDLGGVGGAIGGPAIPPSTVTNVIKGARNLPLLTPELLKKAGASLASALMTAPAALPHSAVTEVSKKMTSSPSSSSAEYLQKYLNMVGKGPTAAAAEEAGTVAKASSKLPGTLGKASTILRKIGKYGLPLTAALSIYPLFAGKEEAEKPQAAPVQVEQPPEVEQPRLNPFHVQSLRALQLLGRTIAKHKDTLDMESLNSLLSLGLQLSDRFAKMGDFMETVQRQQALAQFQAQQAQADTLYKMARAAQYLSMIPGAKEQVKQLAIPVD